MNGNKGTHTFQICTRATVLNAIDRGLLTVNLTPMNLLSARDRLREERATARLQHQRQREQQRRRSELDQGKAG